MTIENSRSVRSMSALLGASLTVALAFSASAGDLQTQGDDWRGESRGHDTRRVLQARDGFDLPTFSPVATAGVLVRSESEVEARLAMSGLQPNGAYTIWWMIFNRPQNCDGECGPEDLTDAAGSPDPAKIRRIGGTVFNGTGFITANDGTANVTVLLKDGPLPIGNGVAVPAVDGYLWRGNGLNAYIWTIIRAHGPAEAGRMAEQISTVEPNPANGGTCVLCEDDQAIRFGTASRRSN